MAMEQIFKKVLDLVTSEIQDIVNKEPELYRGYSIEISSELAYAKKITFTPKTIYIAIKFLEANVYFEQTNLPVIIDILAEQNSFEVARTLIMSFIATYNLTNDKEGNILQRYDTPVVLNNFNEIGNGFRTLFSCRGGFLISLNNNPIVNIDYIWETKESDDKIISHTESIKPLVSNWHLANQLDSQGFFETKNLTNSIAQVFSFVINFVVYQFSNSHLFNVMLGMLNGDDDVDGDINYNFNDTVFNMVITFKNGKSINKNMKFVRMNASQPIDGLPTDEYSFTC